MSLLEYSLAKLELEELIKNGTASTSSLRELLGKTTAKVSEAGANDTYVLFSGDLADGSPARVANDNLVRVTPGTHNINSSAIGRLLNLDEFQTALSNVIAREDFGLSNYGAADLSQRVLIDEKFNLLRNGKDSLGGRVSSNSLWDVASRSFVDQNNGNWRIVAGREGLHKPRASLIAWP